MFKVSSVLNRIKHKKQEESIQSNKSNGVKNSISKFHRAIDSKSKNLKWFPVNAINVSKIR